MGDETTAAAGAGNRYSRAYRILLRHPLRLIRELLAEHASPRDLATAGALGILLGSFPLIGLHTVLVYFGASVLRLNRLLALGTSQLCFPPVVPVLCIEVGYYLRHQAFLTEISLRTVGHEALQRFWEWTLGACIVGPVLAIAVGGAIWLVAALVQRRSGGVC